MVSVFPSAFDALVVQDPRIVIETDAGPFVVVNQPTLAADALNEPDCCGVAHAKAQAVWTRTSLSIATLVMRHSASIVRISSA